MNASLRSVAMFLLSDREGCEVYVVCRAVLSVCLVTDWFSRSQHSRPSLEKSHCRVCVSSGARDAIRQDASQLLSSSSLTPRMSRKCPKMSKPSSSQVRIQVAARFTGLHYLVAPQRTIYVVHA